MAKSPWPVVAPYGILTPALQELYWGTSATTGHNHDGTDDDGSAPEIQKKGVVAATVSSVYLTPAQNFNIVWTKIGNSITIEIPNTNGTGGSSPSLFAIEPVTVWPDEMIALNPNAKKVVNVTNAGVDEIGLIDLPSGATDVLSVTSYSGVFSGTKGITAQYLTYHNTTGS